MWRVTLPFSYVAYIDIYFIGYLMTEDLLIPSQLLSLTYCLKYLTYYMRDSQADLQAVGDFLDKSMKLGTNVVRYLSYKFIPRPNLSDPFLAAILHHIQ